jgi:two-component sensor histidine kinase
VAIFDAWKAGRKSEGFGHPKGPSGWRCRVKYGALSTPAGSVDVQCAENGDRFEVTWRERGGPRVGHTINGEGFGTLLARTAVKGQLGGTISHDWAPEGLTIRLHVARDRLVGPI